MFSHYVWKLKICTLNYFITVRWVYVLKVIYQVNTSQTTRYILICVNTKLHYLEKLDLSIPDACTVAEGGSSPVVLEFILFHGRKISTGSKDKQFS